MENNRDCDKVRDEDIDNLIHQEMNAIRSKMDELYKIRTPQQEKLMDEVFKMFIDLRWKILDLLI